jgi:hypothetical protein
MDVETTETSGYRTGPRARLLRIGVVAVTVIGAATSVGVAVSRSTTTEQRSDVRESGPPPVRVRSKLALVRGPNLWLIDLSGRARRRKVTRFRGIAGCPRATATAVAPDASSVAYYGLGGAHVAAVTGADRPLDWTGTGPGCTVSWSADSKRAAFVAGHDGLIVEPGRRSIPIAGATGISFAPDGIRAAVTGTPDAVFGAVTGPGLHVLDLGPRTWRTIDPRGLTPPLWGPAEQIAYLAPLGGARSELRVIASDGSSPRTLLTTASTLEPFAFTPDGRRLIAVHRRTSTADHDRIEAVDVATGAREVIVRDAVALGIDHTGRRLLVGLRANGRLDLRLVTITTHHGRRLQNARAGDGASWTG